MFSTWNRSSGTGCDACHGIQGGGGGGIGTWESHSTHTSTTDPKGPHIVCGDCHNASTLPYFKSGVDNDPADGNTTCRRRTYAITATAPAGVVDGVNDPVVGAKNNWAGGAYNGTNLKPGKEAWCSGCHDNSPANSNMMDRGVRPKCHGRRFTYGYAVTGHGKGAVIQCISCHDTKKITLTMPIIHCKT